MPNLKLICSIILIYLTISGTVDKKFNFVGSQITSVIWCTADKDKDLIILSDTGLVYTS